METYSRYKLRVEIPTDTAEREQKPSLAWIMPSREEEKPTLCRINQRSHTLGGMTCFLSPLSTFIF